MRLGLVRLPHLRIGPSEVRREARIKCSGIPSGRPKAEALGYQPR